MCTKFFSDGAVHAYFNPYETPYDAFMNYMNVLSDFEIRRLNAISRKNIRNPEGACGVNPIDVPTITAMAVNPAIRKGDNARHVLRP